jgi:hypothetical protein
MYQTDQLEKGQLKCKGANKILPEDYPKLIEALKEDSYAHFITKVDPIFIRRFGQIRVTSMEREIRATFQLKRYILPNGGSRPYHDYEELCRGIEKMKLPLDPKMRTHLSIDAVPKSIKDIAEKAVDDLFRYKDLSAKHALEQIFVQGGYPSPQKIAEDIFSMFKGQEKVEQLFMDLMLIQSQRTLNIKDVERVALFLNEKFHTRIRVISEIVNGFNLRANS